MGDYRKNAETIIKNLGGPGNIASVSNCMTRLRIVVIDDEKADEAGIRSVDDVLGLIHDRACNYEIVVGSGKSAKYAGICREIAGADPEKAVQTGERPGKDEKGRKGRAKNNLLKDALKTLGDIFIPLIPGIIAAGLCAGFASLIAQAVPDYENSSVWNLIYNLLALINTAFMMYITAWAGYRAAERFGATPILGGMLGMITSLDGINTIAGILGLSNADAPLASILRAGKGGVLAVIFGVLLLSFVEKKLRKLMPDSLDIILTPLLTLLICVIPYVLVIMPAFGYVSGGIAWALGQICLSGNIFVRILAGFISSAVFLPLVAAGMHHGLVALYSVQLEQFGYVTLYPALAMAGAGQVGAALAIRRKAKRVGNRRLCSVIDGAVPAGFLGVGEPLIYGVTLPLGKPFITAGIGAGFGGALVMAFEVASTTWGPSGLLGAFVMTDGPMGAVGSILIYLAGLGVSYVCSYIITALTYNEKELIPEEETAGEDHAAGSEAGRSPVEAEAHKTVLRGETVFFGGADNKDAAGIASPADGRLIPMEEIPDPVFSGGTLGPCLGILPENGTICAPCGGIVSLIAETSHAITITASDGRIILIHAGIDTVRLQGRGMTVRVKEGDPVTQGQTILEEDIGLIREAGYSPMVIAADISG